MYIFGMLALDMYQEWGHLSSGEAEIIDVASLIAIPSSHFALSSPNCATPHQVVGHVSGHPAPLHNSRYRRRISRTTTKVRVLPTKSAEPSN